MGLTFNTGLLSDAIKVDSTLKVGVGSSSPRTNLSVTVGTTPTSVPTLGTASQGLAITNDSNTYGVNIGTLNTGNAFIQAMRFDSTATAYSLLLNPSGGNVGIGTSNPLSKLHIKQSSGGYTGGIWVESNLNASELYIHYASAIDAFAIGATYETGGAYKPIAFFTSDVERMRIFSSGNISINSTTDLAKLYVNGTFNATTTLASGYAHTLSNQSTAAGANGLFVDLYSASSSSYALAIRTNDGNSYPLRVRADSSILYGTSTASTAALFTAKSSATATTWGFGPNIINSTDIFRIETIATTGVYLTSGNTSWTANSDERLKDITGTIENAIDALNTLRTIKFSWKKDETNKINLGLIAQDVIKVFPEVVDINDDDIKTLGVKYTELVPVLIAAIKELSAKVTALENK